MASASGIKAGMAWVEITAKDVKLRRALDRSSKRLKAFGASVSKVGVAMVAASAAAAVPFALAIREAAKMEEIMQKFNVVFGENAEKMKAWGDTYAKEVGRSKKQIASFLASAQDLFVPLGFDEAGAMNMSKQIAKLAVDLASFNDKADADTMRDLQAALTGSGEVMKKYGVIVDEAAVKLELLRQGQDPKIATNAMKVQARMNIIMKGTTKAQGDAVRSSGSFTNQMKRLTAGLADAGDVIGGAILPDITKLIVKVNEIAVKLTGWIKENKGLVMTLVSVVGGVLAAGVALVILGKAAALAGVLMKVASVSVGVVTSAMNILMAVTAAIASPIGLVVAGLTALAAYALYASGAIGKAADWMGKRWKALKDTALKAFQGIKDAMAAGDIVLAADIMWTSLEILWIQASEDLYQIWKQAWLDMKLLWVVTGRDILSLSIRMWHEFGKVVEGTTDKTSKVIIRLVGYYKKLANAKDLVTGRISFDASIQREKKISESVTQTLKGVDASNAQRIKQIDENKAELLKHNEDAADALLEQLVKRNDADIAERRTYRSELGKELDALLALAEDERRAAEDEAAGKPGADGGPSGPTPPGAGAAGETASAVYGTFRGATAGRLGPGKVMTKIAEATERTAAATESIDKKSGNSEATNGE